MGGLARVWDFEFSNSFGDKDLGFSNSFEGKDLIVEVTQIEHPYLQHLNYPLEDRYVRNMVIFNKIGIHGNIEHFCRRMKTFIPCLCLWRNTEYTLESSMIEFWYVFAVNMNEGLLNNLVGGRLEKVYRWRTNMTSDPMGVLRPRILEGSRLIKWVIVKIASP